MAVPTTSEFLNAANYAYRRDATLPPSLTQFEVDGQPVQLLDNATGFFATALQTATGEIIVAFEGTDLRGFADNPQFVVAQVLADYQIYLGQIPTTHTQALQFTNDVLAISGSNEVFIAGHSLGAGEAMYVGAQTGLAGQTYGGPGIPMSAIPAGRVSALTNYVEYGDPVGNYSASPNRLGDFLYSDQIVRFGSATYLGNPLDVIQLEAAGRLFAPGSSDAARLAGAGLLADAFERHHPVPFYAQDLGVTIYGTPASGVEGLSTAEIGSIVTSILNDGVPVSGGLGADTLLGASTNDALRGGAGDDVMRGLGGNDRFFGGAGNDSFDGGTGTDRAIFTFALPTATVDVSANGATTITGPEGTDTFRGIEQFQFRDRTIDIADGSPLVDDLFYLIRNPDVAAAGVDPDTHYFQSGAAEGRDPNAFFSTTGYLAANPSVRAAGINPITHYDQVGWREGRDPGANFDNESYLTRNPDVRAAGYDPLAHFLQFGQEEHRITSATVGRASDIGSTRGFDAEFYLLSNPDVARAAITASGDSFAFARTHYNNFGVTEGRDPNSIFDTDGYLAAYADVRTSGVNPLTHYDQFGFREGRDPSAGFDTTAYLTANTDVQVAGIDPMVHYLQFGLYEGRSPQGDSTFGTSLGG